MKFSGFTNKIKLKNNIIFKKSVKFHNTYLDKKNEYNFLLQLSDLNQDCLLKPLEFEFNNGVLKSKYTFLKDFKNLNELTINEKVVDSVIENIKKLHNLKIDKSNLKNFEYINFLNIFQKNTKNKLEVYDEYIKLLKNYELTFNSLEQVLSHNDLVPGNILLNAKKVVFIDYDFVSLNNKFFDLASFITETLNENESLIKYFINKCIDEKIISVQEMPILNKVIKYQDVLWTLWANFMYEKRKEKIFLKIYQDKLDRLKNRKTY